jgi:sugar transferase (PEP-CTERM/EpsH1 system associated)
MNILYLAHRVPYPPNKGERIRAFHEIEFLAKRHAVDVFCPATSQDEIAHCSELHKWCRNIVVEKVGLGEVSLRMASALMLREAISPARFYSTRLKHQVRAALMSRRYDLVFVNCSSMAQYLPNPAPCPVIVDFVDVDSAKWLQYSRRLRFPMSWIYRREARCLSELELKLVADSAASIVISDKEAKQLAVADRRIHVIGNGANAPDPNAPTSPEIEKLKPYVVFIGTMSYLPNIDAVRHFSREIFPKLLSKNPALKFVIVGREPGREVRALSRLPGVHVTGEVADTGAYLRAAHVAVAPFRVSQGVHNKILEAIIAGVPVVCTAPPVEALPGNLRRSVVLASDATDFANKVAYFLDSEGARMKYRDEAAQVCNELLWERVLEPLEDLIEEVAGGHAQVNGTPVRSHEQVSEVVGHP